MRFAFAAALLLGLPTAALAQEGDDAEAAKVAAKETADAQKAAKDVADAEVKQSSGPFSAGKVVVRGTAGADLGQVINLGGTNSGVDASAYVEGGLGYYVIDNLELDVDASAHVTFGAPVSLVLTVTPGLRYQILPQFTIRAGVPIEVLPHFGLGVLAGAAFCQPMGSNASFVLGVDYTYWLTADLHAGAPYGRVEPHVGIQTHF